jgi:hypothetical protein
MRCPVKIHNAYQCGNYKGHQGGHTLLVATVFDIAEERLRLDAP